MIVVVAFAVAYAAGVDPRRLAVLAAAVYLPFVVAALVALHWYRARPRESSRPQLFCDGVAAELRAGASLRDALTRAAEAVGCDPVPNDVPIAELAVRVANQFPAIRRELGLTVTAASRAGSDAATLFDEIGGLAIAQAEILREVRVATAPGRATALVLLAAPVFYLASQLGSGGLSQMVERPEQRLVALLGLGLFLLGLVIAGLVLWRSVR